MRPLGSLVGFILDKLKPCLPVHREFYGIFSQADAKAH